jgi:hypothetical protein
VLEYRYKVGTKEADVEQDLISHGEGIELDFDPYAPVYADEPHAFEYLNGGDSRCEVKHRDGTRCGMARWEHVW